MSSKREPKQRRRVGGALVIMAGIVLALGLGLGLGLRPNPPPPTTTTAVSTTTSGTTGPPTTTPTPYICPMCNASYVLVTEKDTNEDNSFYFGQLADYYVAGESFTYMNASIVDPYNITLARTSKCTGVELWSRTLCGIYSDYGQYLTVDQTNGDVYFVYQCAIPPFNTPETFVDRYDTNGILLWRQNITTLNTTTRIRDLESPITLNYERQHLYFGYRTQSGYPNTYVACSFNMSNGVTLWCFSGDLSNPEWGYFSYDNTLGILYGIQYGPGIFTFNETTGQLITLTSTAGFMTYGYGLDTDIFGNVYLYGNNYINLDGNATVRKYDNTLTLIWTTTFSPPNSTGNFGFTFNMRDLLYDPIANLVIIGGDSKNVGNNRFRSWIAFFDGTTGVQSDYRTLESLPINQVFAALIPDYEQRTVYMSYEAYNSSATFPKNQYVKAFCY